MREKLMRHSFEWTHEIGNQIRWPVAIRDEQETIYACMHACTHNETFTRPKMKWNEMYYVIAIVKQGC